MENTSRFISDFLRLLLEQGIQPIDIFNGLIQTFCVGWEDGLNTPNLTEDKQDQIDHHLSEIERIFTNSDKPT